MGRASSGMTYGSYACQSLVTSITTVVDGSSTITMTDPFIAADWYIQAAWAQTDLDSFEPASAPVRVNPKIAHSKAISAAAPVANAHTDTDCDIHLRLQYHLCAKQNSSGLLRADRSASNSNKHSWEFEPSIAEHLHSGPLHRGKSRHRRGRCTGRDRNRGCDRLLCAQKTAKEQVERSPNGGTRRHGVWSRREVWILASTAGGDP